MKGDALLLFSGGKDSFLSACLLVDEGFRVHLVTFSNGADLSPEHAKHGADRLSARYGEDRCHYLGAFNIAWVWRQLFLDYVNKTPTVIKSEYGDLTASQMNCLTCRAAMYVWALKAAKVRGWGFIAEGARHSQSFVVQHEPVLRRFRALLKTHAIELRTPVFDITNDLEIKNGLLRAGFVPKTLEPQCLVGVPLPNGKVPDEQVEAAGRYYDVTIAPIVDKLIESDWDPFNSGKGELEP